MFNSCCPSPTNTPVNVPQNDLDTISQNTSEEEIHLQSDEVNPVSNTEIQIPRNNNCCQRMNDQFNRSERFHDGVISTAIGSTFSVIFSITHFILMKHDNTDKEMVHDTSMNAMFYLTMISVGVAITGFTQLGYSYFKNN